MAFCLSNKQLKCQVFIIIYSSFYIFTKTYICFFIHYSSVFIVDKVDNSVYNSISLIKSTFLLWITLWIVDNPKCIFIPLYTHSTRFLCKFNNFTYFEHFLPAFPHKSEPPVKTGGLLCPCKGRLPAWASKALRIKKPQPHHFLWLALKGLFLFTFYYWLTRKRVCIFFETQLLICLIVQ